MLLLLTDSWGSEILLSLLEPRSVLKPSRVVHSMSLRDRVREAWTQLAPKTLGRRTDETQSRLLTPLVSLHGQSCSCWFLWEPRMRGDLGRWKILSQVTALLSGRTVMHNKIYPVLLLVNKDPRRGVRLQIGSSSKWPERFSLNLQGVGN